MCTSATEHALVQLVSYQINMSIERKGRVITSRSSISNRNCICMGKTRENMPKKKDKRHDLLLLKIARGQSSKL